MPKLIKAIYRHGVFFVAVIAMTSTSMGAFAAENKILTDGELTKQECSACHYYFSKEFLPAFSWKIILDGLDDHFGEDASLDEETKKRILRYLAAGRAISIPLRITDTGWWKRAHGASWQALAAQSNINVSDCGNCHRPDN